MPAANDRAHAILFVDDEDKARKYFDLAFARHWPVLTAPDVETAIAILAAEGERIAVLITDQRMPGKQGVDLLRHARTYHPQVVRMLTTAYSDLADAIEAVNRGEILRYISKPWDIKALEIELRHAMEFFQLRSERDALLHEKLSVRQRMLYQARLRDLLVIASGLVSLRHREAAVEAFVDALIGSVSPITARIDELEMFGLDITETRAMAALAVDLGGLVQGVTSGFGDARNARALFAAAAAAARVALEDIPQVAMDLHVEAAIAVPAIADLLRLAGSDAVSVRLAAAPMGGLRADIDGSESLAAVLGSGLLGSPAQQRLLRAFLVVWHHGGALEIADIAGRGRYTLILPEAPEQARLPAPEFAWIENLYARVEAWGRGG